MLKFGKVLVNKKNSLYDTIYKNIINLINIKFKLFKI